MFKKISIFALIIWLSGCGTIKDVVVKTAKVLADPSIKVGESKDQPTKIALSINASSQLNINIYSEDSDFSRATPLAFKVLQLKDDSLFQSADFESLEDDLKGTLSSTYLAHDDYEIEPGKFKFVDYEEVHKNTRFIGVTGAYNNYGEVIWKAITKIKPVGDEYAILLQFNSKEVEIKKEGKVKNEKLKMNKHKSRRKTKSRMEEEIDLENIDVNDPDFDYELIFK